VNKGFSLTKIFPVLILFFFIFDIKFVLELHYFAKFFDK